MGILLICWGWDSSTEHACLPVVSPGIVLWSLQKDSPALFTGVQQKLGSAWGSKLRGQAGLLDVGLLPQGLHPSLSLGHSPEASYRQGRGYGGGEEGKLEHGSHQQKWPASPRPSSVLRGARDRAVHAVFWMQKVLFAMQPDGFSDGREN